MNEHQQENPMYHNPNLCNSRDHAMPQPLSGRRRPQTVRRPLFCLAMLFCLAGAGTAVAFDQPQICTLKTNDHIVFIGDSTTAGGFGPTGYGQLLIQALGEQMPGVKVNGIGKNTQPSGFLVGVLGPNHLFDKLVKDGLAKAEPEPAPTICISIIGLNDSKSGPSGVETFTKNLREGVRLMRERKLTAILATPSTWGGLTQTKPYAEAARVLAAELKCPLIDLYAVQSELITAHTKDGNLDPVFNPTCDGVHLSAVGSTLWAGTILKAFGLKPEWKKYQLNTAVTEVGALHRAVAGEMVVEPKPSNPKQPNYEPGTKVTLTCKPPAGWVFVHWIHSSGEPIAEKSTTLTITMDRHQYIAAQLRKEGVKP